MSTGLSQHSSTLVGAVERRGRILRSPREARALARSQSTRWVTHDSEPAWSGCLVDNVGSSPEPELAPV